MINMYRKGMSTYGYYIISITSLFEQINEDSSGQKPIYLI